MKTMQITPGLLVVILAGSVVAFPLIQGDGSASLDSVSCSTPNEGAACAPEHSSGSNAPSSSGNDQLPYYNMPVDAETFAQAVAAPLGTEPPQKRSTDEDASSTTAPSTTAPSTTAMPMARGNKTSCLNIGLDHCFTPDDFDKFRDFLALLQAGALAKPPQ
jgi:hypothetical protein